MAFSGKPTHATYELELLKDVSAVVSRLSEISVPFLSFIGDPEGFANVAVGSTEHNWLEDEYTPGFTLTASTAVDSATAATGVQVDGWGDKLQLGDILRIGGFDTTEEHVLITSIVGANSVLFNRAFGGTSNHSLAAGGVFGFVSNAKLEGEDRQPDISLVRTQKTNWVHYMAKPVEVSGTMEAVAKAGGITSEYDYQMADRLRGILRDLERQVLLGASVGTIGDGTNRRTLKGAWNWITNTHTATTMSTSFLDNAVESGYDLGGDEYDFLVLGSRAKVQLDQTPAVNIIQTVDETKIGHMVTVYQSGLSPSPIRVITTRQMDPRGFILGRREDFRVLPLKGRSFQRHDYAETKDSKQGEVFGEYTLEVRRAGAQVRGYVTG